MIRIGSMTVFYIYDKQRNECFALIKSEWPFSFSCLCLFGVVVVVVVVVFFVFLFFLFFFFFGGGGGGGLDVIDICGGRRGGVGGVIEFMSSDIFDILLHYYTCLCTTFL